MSKSISKSQCLYYFPGAIAMSILFLNFEPAKRDKDGHLRPFHMSYVWIGMPIEVIISFYRVTSHGTS